jgi:hypothetical protein
MVKRISASFTNGAQFVLNEIPSGFGQQGDLGTARDREGPYYGAFHLQDAAKFRQYAKHERENSASKARLWL